VWCVCCVCGVCVCVCVFVVCVCGVCDLVCVFVCVCLSVCVCVCVCGRKADENCVLLGCYTASSASFSRTFPNSLSVPFSNVNSIFWNLDPPKMSYRRFMTESLAQNVCSKLAILAA